MNRLELDGVLNQELEENPVLEEGLGPEEEASQESTEAEEDPFESLNDIDLEAYFGDDNDTWENSGVSSLNEQREGPPLENRLTREPDLYDHLLWQLRMAEVSSEVREIAELVIGNLSPDGFLVATIDAALFAQGRAEIQEGWIQLEKER